MYLNKGISETDLRDQPTISITQEMSPMNHHPSESLNYLAVNNSNQNLSEDSIPISTTNEKSFQARFRKSFRSVGKALNRSLSTGFNKRLTFELYSEPNDPEDEYIDVEVGPKPTDPKLKKEWFYHTLFKNLSKIYAILLFLTGCILYLLDITDRKEGEDVGAAFNVALMIIQLSWFTYIHIDVRRYINSINMPEKNINTTEEKDSTQLETNYDGVYSSDTEVQTKKMTQKYGFTSGRHGGSSYLKIGAVVFCLGYLVHTGLNLAEKISRILMDKENETIQDIWFTVLQPIYAFYQLFFICQFSNLIINVRRRLSKFALMHSIATSLLFWFYTIAQEVLHDLHSIEEQDVQICEDTKMNMSTKMNISTKMGTHHDEEHHDEQHDAIHKLHHITPYLYPFSIEYNILIVGFWILLWENIGKMDRNTLLPSKKMTDEESERATTAHNIIVDCSHTNRGLFAGIFITVACSIAIILLHVFSAPETMLYGQRVNGYTEFISLVAMTLVAILAYLKMRHLDIASHSMTNIDDIMLYMCLPAIFLYSVFSLVPAIHLGATHIVLVSIAQVIQVIIQTVLISDGLSRRSNSRALISKKPGKQLITFLIVANLALWFLGTFQIKTEAGNTRGTDFYGMREWILLSRITLPVALFYRFHSSVCLVDIWKGGYEKDTKH